MAEPWWTRVVRVPPQRIEPMPQPSRLPGKKTLAAIVGIPVAIALGVSIPADESGRTVIASVSETTNELVVRHVRGRQYLAVYLDLVRVPTACDGLTRDADGRPLRLGQTFTEAQCAAMLEQALIAHAERIMACTPGLALSEDPETERRRQGPRFASISLGYNVGTGAFCRSTARARFNAGNYAGGCEAITWFNKAGGRVVPGLVARRQRERAICLRGL